MVDVEPGAWSVSPSPATNTDEALARPQGASVLKGTCQLRGSQPEDSTDLQAWALPATFDVLRPASRQ